MLLNNSVWLYLTCEKFIISFKDNNNDFIKSWYDRDYLWAYLFSFVHSENHNIGIHCWTIYTDTCVYISTCYFQLKLLIARFRIADCEWYFFHKLTINLEQIELLFINVDNKYLESCQTNKKNRREAMTVWKWMTIR